MDEIIEHIKIIIGDLEKLQKDYDNLSNEFNYINQRLMNLLEEVRLEKSIKKSLKEISEGKGIPLEKL